MASSPPAPPPPGDFLHGLIHGFEAFALAFVAQLALIPHKTGRDAVFSVVIGAIRAVWAVAHHQAYVDHDEERLRRVEVDVELLKAAAIEDIKDSDDHEARLRTVEQLASEIRGFTKAITFLAGTGALGSITAIVIGLSGHH